MTELKEILTEIIDYTETFLDILSAERKLLEKNNTEEFEKLLERKKELLITLGTLCQQQQRLLQKAQCTNDVKGLKKYIDTHLNHLNTDRYSLIALIKKLRSLTSLCQEQNKINAAVVSIRQQYTARLMQLLFKVPQSVTYGANAKNIRPPHQRSLNRA